MFFNKKIDKAAQLLTSNPNRTYWQEVSYRFGKNRIAIWALRFLYVILFIALAADFIANDKPLVCSLDKQIHFPVFHDYGVKMGIAKWEVRLGSFSAYPVLANLYGQTKPQLCGSV